MQTIRKLVALSVVALGVGACSLWGLELGPTKKLSPQGDQFSVSLFDEYLSLSQIEYDEGHYGASDFFARKAKAAARGETVLPTEMSEVSLSAAEAAVLGAQRSRLMGALDATARIKAPKLAARTQAMFDCWMEEQEENRQPDDIALCRDEFLGLIDRLEAVMAPPKMVEAPAPAPAPVPAPQVKPEPPVQKSFLVFFDWDSATVTPQADEILAEALKNAVRSKAGSVQLVGHADTSGPSVYNQGLSLRRAEAVRTALRGKGLDTPAFDVVAKGETDPLVTTGDGIREPQNRRVQIILP
jgi:OmpA-OmpF porin, OOP family